MKTPFLGLGVSGREMEFEAFISRPQTPFLGLGREMEFEANKCCPYKCPGRPIKSSEVHNEYLLHGPEAE